MPKVSNNYDFTYGLNKKGKCEDKINFKCLFRITFLCFLAQNTTYS